MSDLQATVVFWLVVLFWWVVPALLYLVFWLGRLGLIDNFRAIRGHMTYCKRCDRPSRCHCYWGKEHLSWEPCEACPLPPAWWSGYRTEPVLIALRKALCGMKSRNPTYHALTVRAAKARVPRFAEIP